MSNKNKGGKMKTETEKKYIVSFAELKEKLNIEEDIVMVGHCKIEHNKPRTNFMNDYGIEVVVK